MANNVEIDYLTGLANRQSLYAYYEDPKRDQNLHAMFLDLDNFKTVNDIYGHSMGDELLIAVARMMEKEIDGFVCRMGGDEFVALLPGSLTEDQVKEEATNLMEKMTQMDFRQDILSRVSFSIGIVMYESKNEKLDDILYKCDTAMYQAKRAGKNRYVVYDPADESLQIQKIIEMEMEDAIKKDQFELYLQPKMNIFTMQTSGAEALSRWNLGSEMRYPEVYMPIFEKDGFVSKLDFYMFEKLCKAKASWRGQKYAHIPVSINVSRLHMYEDDFIPRILQIADTYDIPHEELDFEFNEKVLVKDSENFNKTVLELKKHGFAVTVDNFKSGFDALAVLKNIPVDTIKFDRRFVMESFDDEKSKKILKYSIAMCLALKMRTIIVGVTSQDQVEFIMDSGVRLVQGSLFCKPVTVDEFEIYSGKYGIYENKEYSFRLNGDLKSEDGTEEGRYVGDGPATFVEGIYKDSKALHFPGGKVHHNVLALAPNIMENMSYTVSLWFKPGPMHLFESAVYIRYKTGFSTILPLAWEGNSAFRVHVDREPMNWYDTPALQAHEDRWTMMTITYNSANETSILYINGGPANRISGVPSNHTPQEILIGGDWYQDSFIGEICELKFYNEVKDDLFIKELYDSYVTREGFTENHGDGF
ncbi:MAG: EAL domain-containing protein [Eubacterium sp.]|nr:EAL domain-containing protein [Eubacterium sp.]